MSPNEQTHQHWSNLLAKTKMQHQNTLRVPIATRRKQIDDQITYYKNLLTHNLQTDTSADNESIVKKLIDLRATQTMYILRTIEEERGFLDTQTTQSEVQRYTRDCLMLAHSIGLS